MSRKDYVALAGAIRKEADAWPPSGSGSVDLVRSVIQNVAEGVADALAADNPNFNRERFMAAALGGEQ